MKAVLSANDGETGGLVKDHGDGRVELTALFNTSGVRGAGLDLMRQAVAEQGVNYLECYGAQLPGIYRQAGFEITETHPFDESMAAPDWDYEKYDHPDYNIMTLGGQELATRLAMRYNGAMAQLDSLPEDQIDAVLAQLKAEAQAAADPEWWALYGEASWEAALAVGGVTSPQSF